MPRQEVHQAAWVAVNGAEGYVRHIKRGPDRSFGKDKWKHGYRITRCRGQYRGVKWECRICMSSLQLLGEILVALFGDWAGR